MALQLCRSRFPPDTNKWDWVDSNRIDPSARDIEVKVYRCAMASELQGRFEALIGKRLTIRLHDPEGGFRDIVGVLESTHSLRNRHGRLIEFAHDDIFIWREVIAKT
jgi:hypothetical protein